MSDLLITVRGKSEARVRPERAHARVRAAVDGPDRAEVVSRVAELAEPVRADLAARADAGRIDDWHSDRVAVWAERPWTGDGSQPAPVHHATVEIRATFTDLPGLADWLNEIAVVDGLHIDGVDWDLSPATRARVEREVATAAVGAAVARAEAYAAALGRTGIRPVEIADLGLLAGPSPSAGPAMMRAAKMDAAPPAVDARPDDIVVGAAVEGRFAVD
jgi:uncharacterized protein YggE